MFKKIGFLPDKKELKKDLENNSIPLKYSYINNSNIWQKITKNKNYKLGTKEIIALKKIIKKVNNKTKLNFIHIGVGYGREIPIISKKINFRKNNYIGVDISERLIKESIKNNQRFFKNINYKFYLTDVEIKKNIDVLFKKINNYRKVILLSGEGTLLSNKKILKNISKNMTKQDCVLITLEKYSGNKIINTYSNNESKNFFREILKSYNIKGEILPARYNPKKQQVEVYTLDKRKKIKILESYKPKSKKDLEKTLIKNNIKSKTIYLKKEKMYLVIGKKK